MWVSEFFAKELEVEILGDKLNSVVHFLQWSQIREDPSRSFRPVKSAEILWQFWVSTVEGLLCGCMVIPLVDFFVYRDGHVYKHRVFMVEALPLN
ncbi:hypothetical protein Tco_0725813 [Tanacetum coccineum]|uniref:Uncharacterized protein n=1 Tax=Tanacetum coccineum TaxID=301880 RepID=A0ABQ4YET8_9ASTR